MNILQAIDFVQSEISQRYDREEALVDARYLLSFILEKNFTWLKTWPDKELEQDQLQHLRSLVERRKKGEPIAYITGQKHFWTLTLKTNPSTLIPRPETELLVEKALDFLSHYDHATSLDLGTGTGAIALAIASERTGDKVMACDYHLDAVALAQANAALNRIFNINIIQSDWFTNIKKQKFQLIVSNPPYIDASDPHLLDGDLVYEPSRALISGDDGLADIEKIVMQSKNYLVSGGGLMIEHGYRQGQSVRAIFSDNGYLKVNTFCDLAKLERVTFGLFSKRHD